MDIVHVYIDADGWRWRRETAQGSFVSGSGIGLATKVSCLAAARERNPGVPVVVEDGILPEGED